MKNYKLFIDRSCPLCLGYSKVFEKSGILDSNSKAYYQTMDLNFRNIVDLQRARNEIALLDTDNNHTLYGLDAILFLIKQKYTVLYRIATLSWIYIFLLRVYKLISRNRKVIFPAKGKIGDLNCEPVFNLKYRFVFLSLLFCFNNFILSKFSNSFFAANISSINGMEWLISLGLIVWQVLFLYVFKFEVKWDYIGQLLMVSIIGSLCLVPILAIDTIFHVSLNFTLVYFGLVVFYMFKLHITRTKAILAPRLLNLSWLLYFLFCFLLIFKF